MDEAKKWSNQPATENPVGFSSALVRKLLESSINEKSSTRRITNDAVTVTGELLRLFVVEARYRASIEAECEKEANDIDVNLSLLDEETKIALSDSDDDTENDVIHVNNNEMSTNDNNTLLKSTKKNKSSKRSYSGNLSNGPNKRHSSDSKDSDIVTIRADHVTKIAAELVFDFS